MEVLPVESLARLAQAGLRFRHPPPSIPKLRAAATRQLQPGVEGAVWLASRGFKDRLECLVPALEPCRQAIGRVQPQRGQSILDLPLALAQRVHIRAQHVLRVHGSLYGPRAGQDAEQGVVVSLADRVELVVVASRARHRQPLERLGDHIDLIVGPLDPVLPRVHRLESVLDHAIVGRADQ